MAFASLTLRNFDECIPLFGLTGFFFVRLEGPASPIINKSCRGDEEQDFGTQFSTLQQAESATVTGA